jgi:exonuclease III
MPTQSKSDKLNIATFNVRTLMNNERITELEYATEEVKWDIIGISEIRREGEAIMEKSNNYIFYYSGKKQGKNGVGFWVKSNLKEHIQEFTGISDRIAMLTIKLPGYTKKWSIIQIYAPHEEKEDEEKDQFYEQLSETMQERQGNVIVMGDFNSQLGEQQPHENKTIGKFSYGKRNNNGERLLNFAIEHNLSIMNTFFKKRRNTRWTWRSPDGKTLKELDFILTNQPKIIENVEVLKSLNFNSDHRMLRTTLTSKEAKKSRKHINPGQCILPMELPEVTLKELEDSLENKLKNIQPTYIQERYNCIELELKNLTNKLKPEFKKKDQIGEEARELLKARKKMIINGNVNKSDIAEISKNINNSIKKYRKKQRTDTIMAHIEKTGGIKRAEKELREYKTWIPNMKDNKTGKKKTNRKDMMAVATEFYRDLYNDNCEESIDIHLEGTNEDIVAPIIESEIRNAIRTQKNHKAPGDDKITNELLKRTETAIIQILKQLFNDILDTETIPKQWTESVTILLHKKGDKNRIENYRPISLMSNLYKVFSKILLNRMTKTLELAQPQEQAGFRSNFSTIDHIHVIKQVIEKCNEYNQTYYLSFIDYNKAFDSIKHSAVWSALKSQGIEYKYIRVIKEIYKNSTARIRMEREGQEFQIKKGVRQGDPLSPKLFSAVLELIFQKLNWDQYGININGKLLNHLRFADDLIIMANNPIELETMVQELATESTKVGLSLNAGKTKIMTNSEQTRIQVNNKEIEYVEEYTYLGQIISPTLQMNKEIDQRVISAWKRYWSLQEVMKNKHFPQSLKSKVYNMCILPCATYGSQTWALTQRNTQKLKVCQQNMERSMLNIKRKDKVSLTKIRKKTKVADITRCIKKLKWRWTGHMMREKMEKWTKDITEWYPRQGKRKRGRPIMRWEDDIKKKAGATWRREAKDRTKWKAWEEAYVQEAS